VLRKFSVHVKHNLVGYVALFAAMGGTSYAAVRLTPGSVTARALGSGAVTHAKLSSNSVSGKNVINGTLTAADFAKGLLSGTSGVNGSTGVNGTNGSSGTRGAPGPAGPAGAAGADGNSAIIARGRGTGTVSAPHGASTDVGISGATWTQGANDVNLVTGSVTISTPASCTGSFGNSLVIKVDGTPSTFAVGPTVPASSSFTVPIAVMAVMEPGNTAGHTITAAFANSCTKGGEDYSVSNLKIDVVKFG
jgi:hypothetical protein